MTFVLSVVLSIISTIFRGVVGATLWGWFVVPVTGLPSIGVAVAIGLSCTAWLFIPWTPPSNTIDDPLLNVITAFVTSLTVSSAAFVAAWIALQFAGGAA